MGALSGINTVGIRRAGTQWGRVSRGIHSTTRVEGEDERAHRVGQHNEVQASIPIDIDPVTRWRHGDSLGQAVWSSGDGAEVSPVWSRLAGFDRHVLKPGPPLFVVAFVVQKLLRPGIQNVEVGCIARSTR